MADDRRNGPKRNRARSATRPIQYNKTKGRDYGMNSNLYYKPKRLKKIKEKRTQRVKKRWGWVLTVLGGLSLPSAISSVAGGAALGALAGPLVFLIPGVVLLLLAKRQVDRWDRYEAIIDNYGNTPISLIAKKMGLPEKTVYSDLQEMIHSDFFIGPNCNIEAYIDAERDLLVMSSGGEPLRPLPDLPKEEEEQDARAQGKATAKAGQARKGSGAGKAAEEAAFDAESEEEESITDEEIHEVELTDLEVIQQAIMNTSDDEVRGYLYGLEGSVRRIDERLQDQPELMEKISIKRLYKYYLPQIVELIGKYQDPDTSADLKRQIKGALKTSASALANIEADLLEREQMDAEVDIEVLKNMFAQDGLLDRGGRPQAARTGTAQASAGQTVQAGAAQTAQAGAAQTAQAGAAQASAGQAVQVQQR